MVGVGSAEAGTTMPPVNTVNEIATPEAATTARARPVPAVIPDHLPRAAFVRLRMSLLCERPVSGFAVRSRDRHRKLPPTGFGLCTKPCNLAFQVDARTVAFSQRSPTKVTESTKTSSGMRPTVCNGKRAAPRRLMVMPVHLQVCRLWREA